MANIISEGVSEGGRDAYLQELYRKATEERDRVSFIELSQIASGRTDLPLARELFQKLDTKEALSNG